MRTDGRLRAAPLLAPGLLRLRVVADSVVQDLGVAVRSLLRERSVTALAVGSLAVGIAANATIFSLVQAVEFPRLIYPGGSRLVFLASRNLTRGLSELPVSGPDAFDAVAAARSFEASGLTADRSAVIRDLPVPARRHGREVTPSFFTVM